MHLKTRLTIYNDDQPDSMGFGQGIMMLLEEIDKTGSIKKAAAGMGMAYSKAWKLLTTTEKEFDILLLDRKGHQGSTLSPEGASFLQAYKATLKDIEKTAQKSFKSHFHHNKS